MRMVFDGPFRFTGIGPAPSICRLRLFRSWNCSVALLTELERYGGTSITNGIETVSQEVSSRFGIKASRLMLVEHHRDRRAAQFLSSSDRFEEVRIRRPKLLFGRRESVVSVEWRPIQRSELEVRIGQALSDSLLS